MNDDEINQKLVSLSDVQAQQEKIINDLIGNMIDLDTERFETTLDKYIRSKGIERAINHLIFPFLERIGILWQTNHINAAQEHLVTNIVRQKLIVGVDHEVFESAPRTNSRHPNHCVWPDGSEPAQAPRSGHRIEAFPRRSNGICGRIPRYSDLID